MKQLVRFVCILVALLVTGDLSAESLTSAQQKQLVANLNYLQYSMARIKMSDNKAIAEDIYYSIINELKIESIADRELNFEYGEFLAKCANLKLTQNEKDFIKQLNEKQQKSAYLSAFSNFGSVFVPGRTPHQMVASLIYTAVSSAVAIANTKNQLKTQLEKDMFYLDQQLMRDIYEMQTRLFTTSAKLLSQAGSNGRINENSMNIFMNAIKLSSSSERKNALSEPQLQANFAQFPPYWYELGNAYQELKDFPHAMEAYDKFIQLKQYDIVAKDKNYVKLLKNKIQILLGDSPSKVVGNAIKNKEEIQKCLEIIRQNYLDSEAGEKNAYLAKIYYLIGSVDESLACLNYIIGSKSTHPDFIEEAIKLKLLIESAKNNDTAILYQNAYNYSKIVFGNEDVDYKKLPTKSWWRWFADKIHGTSTADKYRDMYLWLSGPYGWITLAGKFIEYKEKEEKEANRKIAPVEIEEDNLCFRMPISLVENYNITVKIVSKTPSIAFNWGSTTIDKLYSPFFFKQSSTVGLGFIPLDVDDLGENTQLSFYCKSKQTYQDIVINYRISPIEAKYVNAAEKAYKRIGSDLGFHNAETVVEFGKSAYEYDYEVEDVEDERDDIKDDVNSQGKKLGWTKDEINSEITKRLSVKLAPDIKCLQDRLTAVERSYYSRNHCLYAPQLVTYNGDFFLVGVESIYDSALGREYAIDTNANISYVQNNQTQNKVAASLSQLLQAAYGGDINSMVSLGIAYIEGYNTNKNPQEGIRWLLAAVNSDKDAILKFKMQIAQAYKYLGQCYWNGIGVNQDENQARMYYRESKKFGFDIDEKYM